VTGAYYTTVDTGAYYTPVVGAIIVGLDPTTDYPNGYPTTDYPNGYPTT
jgi:hypothetical protein